jgi:hypothetical protein
MVLLSACATKNYKKSFTLILPEMPIAGPQVAGELEELCKNNSCNNLVNYFNQLYIFKIRYTIYKNELSSIT